ncbi:MAG: MFS transporter, partial [Candidatus Heimdallarchaeaceae archaeon]
MNEQSTECSDANAKPSMSLETERETIEPKYKIALYSNVLANSTSRGLVSPFVSMIAITMGASAGLLGWIQSIANLLSTFLTPLFGRLSDKFKRRIPFILISTVTWGIPYLFLYWAKSPVVVVVIVALVNLLMSLGVPAWNALQNELFPPNVRARMASTIFWFDALGSMIATIFTGIVLSFLFSDTDYQKYILLPVSIGLFFSFLVIIPFSRIEEPLQNMKVEDQPSDFKLKESFLRA